MEVTLLAPWIYFLVAGAFDVGIYSYALIATQNAARVAAAYTSRAASLAGNSAAACQLVLEEMKSMSNVRQLSNCSTDVLRVTATAVTGVDLSPASSVSVTYLTNKLIPIPWLVGQRTITRTVQMKVK